MAISNVVTLRKVTMEHETAALDDVVKAVHIKLQLADQKDKDARTHRIEAGEMLVSLRERVEGDGGDWWKFAKDRFDRTRGELATLMLHVTKHKSARSAIAAYPEKSNTAIAAEIGISRHTVSRARKTFLGARAQNAPRAPLLVKAIAANPEKSNSAIGLEVGVSKDAVRRARDRSSGVVFVPRSQQAIMAATALTSHPEKSNRVIAAELGISANVVNKVRNAAAQPPPPLPQPLPAELPDTKIDAALRLVASMTDAERKIFINKLVETYR